MSEYQPQYINHIINGIANNHGSEDVTQRGSLQHIHSVSSESGSENSSVFDSEDENSISSSAAVDMNDDDDGDDDDDDDLDLDSFHDQVSIREALRHSRGNEFIAFLQETNWPIPQFTFFGEISTPPSAAVSRDSPNGLQSDSPMSPTVSPLEFFEDTLMEHSLLLTSSSTPHSPSRLFSPSNIHIELPTPNPSGLPSEQRVNTGPSGLGGGVPVEREEPHASHLPHFVTSPPSPVSLPSASTFTSTGNSGSDWLSGSTEGVIGAHFFSAADFLDEVYLADYYSNDDGVHLDIASDNEDFARFCDRLISSYTTDPSKSAKILKFAREIRKWKSPDEVTAEAMRENDWDCQGIPWNQLGIKKEAFRKQRNKEYVNYRNIKDVSCSSPEPLAENCRFFRFRRQDNTHHVRRVHFQLRNLIGVTSKNDLYYVENSRIIRTDPCSRRSEITMDLTGEAGPWGGMKITTMAAGHEVCIAGGFYGEYAIKGLNAPFESRYVKGAVTMNNNGITNNVHLHPARTSPCPYAVFSSNDNMVRVLDCYRNSFVAQHGFPWAVNCSATSPDGRLRVIVGDAQEVLIADSDRGMVLQTLRGHRDYGFACAWSDDGYSIATGNQDKTVRIYDARNFSACVKEIGANIAGVRALRFSRNGAGRRVLVLAEPADYLSIIDAKTWDGIQKFELFGEIGGIEFTPDGEELFVANTDKRVGGLMEFERVHSDCHDDDEDDEDDEEDIYDPCYAEADSEIEDNERPEWPSTPKFSVSISDATMSSGTLSESSWFDNSYTTQTIPGSSVTTPAQSPPKGDSSCTLPFTASETTSISPLRNNNDILEDSQDNTSTPGTHHFFDEDAEVDDDGDVSINLDPLSDIEDKSDMLSQQTISSSHSDYLSRLGRRRIRRKRSGSAEFERVSGLAYGWRLDKAERRRKRFGVMGMGSLFV